MNRAHDWTKNGYWLESGMFTPEEVAALRDHFMALNGSHGYRDGGIDWESEDPLAKFPRMVHPHRWDEKSLAFLLDKRMKKALVDALGKEPIAAQTMMYFKPPGARGQALHQDNKYLQARPGTCIGAWLALDDCDEENGCLLVVPGSHELPLLCNTAADPTQSFTSDTVPIPEGMEVKPAIMKAGDVLFFHGCLIHGSLPNVSANRFRRALIAHYISGEALEANAFYHPLLRFDGSEIELGATAEGGPCGVIVKDESGERIEMVASAGPVGPEP